MYSKDGVSSRDNYSRSFSFDFNKGTNGHGAYNGDKPYELVGAESSQDSRGLAASISSAGWGSAASATAQGQGKVTYTWGPAIYGPLPQGAQVAPPLDKLSFSIYAYASAGALNKQAVNRDKTGEEASASANGKSSPENVQSPTDVTSRRLYSFDTKGGGPFTVTVDFAAEASIPGGRNGDEGSAFLNFSMSSEEDDRSVRLSRSGATGDFLADDGVTMCGDTTYSYMRPNYSERPDSPLAQILEKNWQSINASFGGTWQSHYQNMGYESYGTSYSWSPSGTHPFYVDSSQSSTHLMPTGSLSMDVNGKWQGTSDPNSYTELPITYEITDTDGAVAKVVYKLRVHNPVELIDTNNWEVHYLTDYYSPLNGGMVTVDYPNAIGGNYQMTNSSSSGWSASSTIGTEFELFKVPLGWDASVSYEESTEEGETESVPTPLKDGTPVVLKLGETVHLRVKHKFQRFYTSFWKYNQAGKIKRYNSGHSGESIEVPHEAIWDKWIDNQFVWTDPYPANRQMPEIDEDERQLPPKGPSYHYSLKEDTDAQPLA